MLETLVSFSLLGEKIGGSMTPEEIQRLYSTAAWRRLSLKVRERAGHRCYVTGCPRRARTADHIAPALEYPSLFFVESNVRASCYPHNSGRANARAAAIVRANERKQIPATVRQW